MEILQNIDPGLLPYIAVGCALLCVVILVIGFLLQAVGSIFEVIFGFAEVVIDLLQGGPIAWLGCLLLILGGLGVAGAVFLLLNAPTSCAANPTNFCRWFGFIP